MMDLSSTTSSLGPIGECMPVICLAHTWTYAEFVAKNGESMVDDLVKKGYT